MGEKMNDKKEMIARKRKKVTIWVKIRHLLRVMSKTLEERQESAYLHNLGSKHIRTSEYGKF